MAKIHVERMMHRSSIAVAGESAASYALVKLIPSGLGAKAMSLNLALVLDVSGSMYEEDGTGISRLKAAGLDSFAGAGAEILVKRPRTVPQADPGRRPLRHSQAQAG